jgi:hypothetical protein
MQPWHHTSQYNPAYIDSFIDLMHIVIYVVIVYDDPQNEEEINNTQKRREEKRREEKRREEKELAKRKKERNKYSITVQLGDAWPWRCGARICMIVSCVVEQLRRGDEE